MFCSWTFNLPGLKPPKNTLSNSYDVTNKRWCLYVRDKRVPRVCFKNFFIAMSQQNLVSVLKEQHESELGQLESLVTSSQELLAKQSRRFMRDLDKLVMTDTNIRGLISQSDSLSAAVSELRSRLGRNREEDNP